MQRDARLDIACEWDQEPRTQAGPRPSERRTICALFERIPIECPRLARWKDMKLLCQRKRRSPFDAFVETIHTKKVARLECGEVMIAIMHERASRLRSLNVLRANWAINGARLDGRGPFALIGR